MAAADAKHQYADSSAEALDCLLEKLVLLLLLLLLL